VHLIIGVVEITPAQVYVFGGHVGPLHPPEPLTQLRFGHFGGKERGSGVSVVVRIRWLVDSSSFHRCLEGLLTKVAVTEFHIRSKGCIGIELPEPFLSRRNVDAHHVSKFLSRVLNQIGACLNTGVVQLVRSGRTDTVHVPYVVNVGRAQVLRRTALLDFAA